MGGILLFLSAVCLIWHGSLAINMTGCIYNEPFPYVINASPQDTGEIQTPGFDEGRYPAYAACDYVVKAPEGYIVKLTFLVMDITAFGRCGKDQIFLNDGPKADGPDLGAYCGPEPPPYPIYSTQNAMYIRFRTNFLEGPKGARMRYEIIHPSDICPAGHIKCKNNNCYAASKKCDGEDDCRDGTDEENCNLPLPTYKCGPGSILPIDEPDSPDRVVGGIAARKGSWPWQADLQLLMFFPNSHHCGGTLIHPQWVMTAAHCLSRHGYETDWRIHLGNHDKYRIEPEEQIRYVDLLIMYPGYVGGKQVRGKGLDFTHDVALMKLNAPVKVTDYVRPACLPPEGYDLPLGTKCIASGWGLTRGSGHEELLKQAEMYVQPDERCFHFNNATMICVKGERGLQDVCLGDSGGPLNCKIGDAWHVMGITSYGSTSNSMSGFCAVTGYGTVFNKVSAKISFLNDMMKRYT